MAATADRAVTSAVPLDPSRGARWLSVGLAAAVVLAAAACGGSEPSSREQDARTYERVAQSMVEKLGLTAAGRPASVTVDDERPGDLASPPMARANGTVPDTPARFVERATEAGAALGFVAVPGDAGPADAQRAAAVMVKGDIELAFSAQSGAPVTPDSYADLTVGAARR